MIPFAGRSFWKVLEILNPVDPPFPVDLLARRPEDVARGYAEGDPLIREALDRAGRSCMNETVRGWLIKVERDHATTG